MTPSPDLAAYSRNNLLTIKCNKNKSMPIVICANISAHSFKLFNTDNLYLFETFLGLSY